MTSQRKLKMEEVFKYRVYVNPKAAWKILERAIRCFYNLNYNHLSFEELYRNAYNMVAGKFGEELYSGLVSTMTTCLKEIAASVEEALMLQGPLFLTELNKKWMVHNNALQMISDVLMYAERNYFPYKHKIPVRELGLNLWRDSVINTINIQTRLKDTLLEFVLKERNGEVINRDLMRNIIKMLIDLGPSVYRQHFEKPFLDVSTNFYQREYRQFIKCCDCGEYLKKVEKRLNEEIDRAAHYLDVASEVKITTVVEKEMIGKRMKRLVPLGLVNMIVDDKYDDLGRMYRLFLRVPNGLTLIRDVMSSHIRETGKQLVTDPERVKDPMEFVQRLLEENDKHDKIINLAFNNDNTFQNALNSAFKYFISLNPRVPEFISLFVDDILRKGLKSESEEKDVFEKCCKQHLAKRLLSGRSVTKKDTFQSHVNRFVHMEPCLVNMIVDDKYDDLSQIYKCFKWLSNGLTLLRDVMTSHIRETGRRLATDPERVKDPVKFVQRLLKEKDKHNKIISLAFNNDKTFQNALNSSFEYVTNLNPRSPEFISLFVDDILRKELKGTREENIRKGLKGTSEEDTKVVLDKVTVFFGYLQEKDVFEKYYKRHLAKRLLSGSCVYEDAERSFILSMKTLCGYRFTSKLEGMLNDMKTSQDTMQGFYESMGSMLTDGPKLAVHILTTGSWPSQLTTTCNLPPEILTVCDKFKTYYLGAHNGRRLTWQTNMGSADIKASFSRERKHELNVSTYQMCVLMLFNTVDRLSYKEIEQAVEIPKVELKRCLHSLACVKGKNVLGKEPMNKDVNEDDEFFFNDEFSSKSYKVKICRVGVWKESEPEKLETRRSVEVDRKPQIEAAIVRVMKARRVLDHNNIVAEVTKQLQSRFLPDPVAIKIRIERLIEREFLERDRDNHKLYRYLA